MSLRLPSGPPSHVWRYHDADGRLVGEVRRWDLPGEPKVVRAFVPDDCGGWRCTHFPRPRPLYRLPGILASSKRTPVLVVEGELAVDAAQAALPDVVVTTWPHGANAVHLADWSPLADRIVCVWPDADPAGDAAAQEAVAACVEVGAGSVHVLRVPDDWPEGHDAADLTRAEVEGVWASSNLWAGGPVDATAIRQRIEARRAARQARRDRRRGRARSDLPTLDVDRAREQGIVDVANELGIEHRRGWARCPFHEDKHPSLHLNPKKNRAFCNPCRRSWDGIALVMELRGLDFPGAVRWLTGEPEPLRRSA